MNKELLEKSVTELAQLIKSKSVSPVEVTENMLQYIESSNPQTNAYVAITADSALKAAKHAENEIMQGKYKGTFHGVPIALKDNIYFANEVTTMCSKIHRDFVSKEDATVTARLREAGAVFTGKLNMHEYAWGIDNNSPHFGAVHNPWNPEKVPGGSSGGSGAAVASHSTYSSLGTDTAGSIRIPSSACGIVGLKPTHGRVSKYGVYPLAWTLDHVGPMSKTVADAAAMLQVIAGFDTKDPTSAPVPVVDYSASLNEGVKGLRIGINEAYFFNQVDSRVERIIRERLDDLEKQGAILSTVSIPALQYAEWAELAISLSEASTIHHEDLLKRPDDFGDDIRFLFEWGELFSSVDYLQAQQVRRALKQQFTQVLREVDVLVAPTLPFLVPNIGDNLVDINGQKTDFIQNCIRFTGPSNLTGLPALSVPAGISEGLPVGLQIIGRAFDEATLLKAAYAIEAMQPLAGHKPVLAP
ncbi:amidase [Paenalcaligenes hermetiae]|uniref:Amidase n=1 Tax=Paenalcaligenes hermetiae TaxID=1157987 RepID=A0ABP9M7H0_9BURK